MGVRQRLWRISWTVILVFTVFYLGLMGILEVFQSHFIYFPQRAISETPHRRDLSYEAINFKAADGVNLSGWFIPAERPRGTILFCHGNAGNISHRLESIQIFHRLKLSTFIFDYRGYGESEGKPTEQGTYLDAEAAWRYLVEKRRVEPTDIIIFGRSLGGTVAAWLAQDHVPKALIMESTFTSVGEMARELYPYLPVKQLLRFDYNALDYLRKVNCPVLIVHSRDDEMVPFNHGRALFEVANEPKEFLEIIGSHNEGFLTSGRRYEEGLDSFISKCIGN